MGQPRLILCLQTSPKDLNDAVEVVRLISDIERERRDDCEFWIAYRRDCDARKIQAMVAYLSRSFALVSTYRASNFSEGWPSGPNSLWTSTMIEASVRASDSRLGLYDGILTFEPDCVPTQRHWINILTWTWRRTIEKGKFAVGHLHPSVHGLPTHLNGNAIFWVRLVTRNPAIMTTSPELAWDIQHAHWLVANGLDTYAIWQMYGYKNLTVREWVELEKHGKRPVLLHGIKDDSARILARATLVPDALGRYQRLVAEPAHAAQ